MIDAWRDLADTVAERVVTIGTWPNGQADAVAAAGDASRLVCGAAPDYPVVRDLTRRLATMSERVRARMDRLGALDVASQDVLTAVVRTLEQQLWMVRAQAPQPERG